ARTGARGLRAPPPGPPRLAVTLSGRILAIAASRFYAGIIMALKIELKPFERIIIGESLITNSDQRTRFVIEGNAPILREKDVLTAETADTPVKRIYLCVQ